MFTPQTWLVELCSINTRIPLHLSLKLDFTLQCSAWLTIDLAMSIRIPLYLSLKHDFTLQCSAW